jgi:hypothetical protein
MVTKYQNSLNPARACNLYKGLALIAALFILGLSSAPASAAEPVSTDPCDSALVNMTEARTIARSLMKERGWIQSRTIRKTLGTGPVFHIRNTKCVNGQWRVSATLREGLSPSRKTVVLINCHSGAIETALRSALMAAE